MIREETPINLYISSRYEKLEDLKPSFLVKVYKRKGLKKVLVDRFYRIFHIERGENSTETFYNSYTVPPESVRRMSIV